MNTRRIFAFLFVVAIVGMTFWGCTSKAPAPTGDQTGVKEAAANVFKNTEKVDSEYTNGSKEGTNPDGSVEPSPGVTPEGTINGESQPPDEGKAVAGEKGNAGYEKPKISSDTFKPAEKDPVTGAAWENMIAVIETNKGTVKISFFHDAAPRHVENFLWLSRDGFFNGLTFHRYEPGFVIQGGDPKGTGSGGPGYTIPAEFSKKYTHVKGAVAQARQSDEVNPQKRSSGSQFYIMLDAKSFLDQAGYTVWGKVVEGMDVVMKLRATDVMTSITIIEKS